MTYVQTYQQIADILPKGSFTRDKWNELMFCLVLFLSSFTAAHFSVVAALVPPAQQVVKRSDPFADEDSKHTGASSKSVPRGKRVLGAT